MDDLDRAADRELHLLDRAVNREDALNRAIARSITISTIVASAAIFGAGLLGMRERVESIGGTLARDMTSGTRLTITIPWLAALHAPQEHSA